VNKFFKKPKAKTTLEKKLKEAMIPNRDTPKKGGGGGKLRQRQQMLQLDRRDAGVCTTAFANL
jgi:hypothetical protein